MTPQPIALGYMRTDCGPNAAPLSDEQAQARHRLIAGYARAESLTLQQTFVEDRPGSNRMFSQLMGAASYYQFNTEQVSVVIIYAESDLGATSTAQAQARERVQDLGVRIEVILSATIPTSGPPEIARHTGSRN